MEEQPLISKIQLLKEMKPAEGRVLSLRSRVAFRMEMDRKKDLLNRGIFTLQELLGFWSQAQPQPAFRLVQGLVVAMLVIMGGGTLTTWAAMQSLPGSPLYPVKLAVEQARVSASLSEDNQLKLQAELADRRLQELSDVVNSRESSEQKADKAVQVVAGIQDQLITVMPKAGVKVEPQRALATAKIMSEKASQAGKALATAKEALPTNLPDLNAKLAEATQAAEKAGMAALETMVTNANPSDEEKKELTAKLSEEVEKTKGLIKAKEQKVAQQNSLADKLPIRAVLINQFEQSLDLLDKANSALKKSDFKGALEMLKAAKAIDSGADEMAQNAANSRAQAAGSNATSSPVK